MLFVDVRIIPQKDDDLTIAVHRSNHMCKDYYLQMSENIPFKKRASTFQDSGNEQVSHFAFLGCDASYDFQDDITNNL